MNTPFFTPACLTQPTAGVTIAEISNWIVPFSVGILPQEQGVTQPLRFSVRVGVQTATTLPASDNWQTGLDASFDYRIVIDTIQLLATTPQIPLLEDIATNIEKACLQHPNVLGLWLKIEKIGLLAGANSIGIERTTWK